MEVVQGIAALPRGLRFAAAIGAFDGLHRGHGQFLRATVAAAQARAAAPVVVTFEPHPDAVLRGREPTLLCDPSERLTHFRRAGISFLVVEHFDEHLRMWSAERFVRALASERDLAGLAMTPDSAFGHDRAGTAASLAPLAAEIGFHITDVPSFVLAGERVSSSRIRALLEAGRLASAERLLGRRYAVIGTVVHGDGRGRGLGYPTANLHFDQPVCLPPNGIYAIRAGWNGFDPLAPAEHAQGVASLGVRPTFGPGERLLEAHLFDRDVDLYGVRLRVEFVRRQRGERRFADVSALVEQMDRDAARARRILLTGGRRKPTC